MDLRISTSLADVAETLGHVGYHWDFKADHIVWFGAWQELFGRERIHPPHNAETFLEVVHPDDHLLIANDAAVAFDREYRLRLANGSIIWVYEYGTADQEQGRLIRQRGILRKIRGPERRRNPVTQGAENRDQLTNRPNRTYMLNEIGRLMDGARELRQSSAYMVISIDKMGFVNEAVGTKSADALLRGVSERLGELTSSKSQVARTGGDMFGVLLPGMARDVKALAEAILGSFNDRPVMTPAGPLHVTLSIGYAQLIDVEGGAADIMIHAEQALHDARRMGRNHHVEYKVSQARAQEHRTLLETGERVKQALKNNGLKLAFQPVVSSETGEVMFYEALVRMFRDDGQMIAAADFIPIVEEQGLALDLDRHVLNLAIRELEAAPSLRLAVNVSGLTAARADWPNYMRQLLGSRRDIASRLIIEITETAAIMDVTEMQLFAETMKRLGAQVSLDDFGAGFTSIRHLRKLSLAIMKIDKELLFNLIDNAEQQHVVRMLIGLARGLNLRIVGEGVENEDVAAWLRAERVDMMQGYYFGRPSLDKPWAGGGAKAEAAKPAVKPAETRPILATTPAAAAEIRANVVYLN